ncbi:hypothetical protein G7Y89_g7257 [Cudoniella acicularis]|uniref:Cytochrome P450 n=1 Tax=Cudoniella acicularis TaxID=354080 RepID=A0A8H4RLJ5_9HELO|nr:hypothetical protein G7Y89_g7257 [Cudoniella acicularis]
MFELFGFQSVALVAFTMYEFYYDIILGGQYLFKITELHKQYGPIIRINPHELHVSDPDFYDTIYAGAGHRRNRDSWHTDGNGLESVVSSPDHDLHHNRRAALPPFFFMAATKKLLPLVEEPIPTLISRLAMLKNTGKPINLYVFSAFSNNVITEYCFGRSEHWCEAERFNPSYYKANWQSINTAAFRTHFPLFPKFLLSLPECIAAHIPRRVDSLTAKKRYLRKLINETKNLCLDNKNAKETIFHTLLTSDLPESEESIPRIIDKAILALKEELHEAKEEKSDGSALSMLELEKLPYLTGCIKEGLRLSYGPSTRMPRVAPDETLTYKDWVIPAGTAVGICTVVAHHDESILPDSHTFKPERWLGDNSRRLDKYLVQFGGGTRICLGINLA